jgi:arylsulfatase A-like enzyme
MVAAAEWLERELGAPRAAGERALLVVDEFDPHEPFDTPERWATRYDPQWEGERIIWPPYSTGYADDPTLGSGLSEREGRHVRAQYGAKLSMIDHWLGRILDTIDRYAAWDTTALILCTDHGLYLGERNTWGKPPIAVYPEMGHIPLMVAWPQVAPETRDALTTTVDVHATLCDAFGVTPEHRTHGRSLVPLLEQTVSSIRECALSGVWGREVHVADATRTYGRAPAEPNRPLSMFSNRWSTMPVRAYPAWRLAAPDERARLELFPGTGVPVIRQPFDPSDRLPYWGLGRFHGDVLYDRFEAESEGRIRSLTGGPDEDVMKDLLVEALRSVDAPPEQLTRLGIA